MIPSCGMLNLTFCGSRKNGMIFSFGERGTTDSKRIGFSVEDVSQ